MRRRSSSSPTTAGALAWVDAVHYAPHGGHRDRRDRLRRAALLAVQVLRPAPRARLGAPRALGELAALQGAAAVERARPAPRDGDAAARAPLRLRRLRRVPPRRRLEVHHTSTSASSGSGSSTGCPDGWQLHGPPTMDGRVPTFCVSPPDETPAEAAARLGGRRLRRLGRQLLRRRGLQAPRARPTARSGSASSTRTWRTRSTGCSRRYRGPSRPRGGRQGLLGDAARAQARREAGHRGRRPLHDEQRGARGPAAGAEGDARSRRRPLGRLAEEGLEARRPTSTSPPCSRPASRPASSTTRAARSTPTGRRSASSTGSPTAEPGRRSGTRDDRPGKRGQDERRRRHELAADLAQLGPVAVVETARRSRRRGRPRACRAATTPRSSRARR